MALIDEQYIFGIKVNGCSQQITKLSISQSQSEYDYVCNVSLAKQCNGNGEFRIAILNKDMIEGMPIGKWTLLNAQITYNWGSSSARVVMLDENGDQTEQILTSSEKGSASGFSVEALARSIFSKAYEIVERYPSAKIVNAYKNLKKAEPSTSSIVRYRETDEHKYLIDRFENCTVGPLRDYLSAYRKLESLLKNDDDVRSKRLLTLATEVLIKIINIFR